MGTTTGTLFELRGGAESVLQVLTHEEAAAQDRQYWRAASHERRLQEVEIIRRVLYGDAVDQGLRGPLEVIECPWG